MKQHQQLLKQLHTLKDIYQHITDQIYLNHISQNMCRSYRSWQLLKEYYEYYLLVENSCQKELLDHHHHSKADINDESIIKQIDQMIHPKIYHPNHNHPNTSLNQSQIYYPKLINQQPDHDHLLTEVVKFVQQGICFQQISNLLKIPVKCVSKFWRIGSNRKIPPGRRVSQPIMEQKVYQCILENNQKGSIIDSDRIQELGIRFSNKKQFKGSKGWIKNFIRRYKLHEMFIIR